jgi:flagellar hook-length control protein FliK
LEQLFIIPEIRTQVSAGAAGAPSKGAKVSSNQSGTFETAFRTEEGKIESACTNGGRQENAPEAGGRRKPRSLQEPLGQAPDSPPDGQGVPLLDAIILALGSEESTALQGSDNGEGSPGEDATSEPDAVQTAIPQWAAPLILLAAAQTGEGDFRILLRQLLQQGPPLPDDTIELAGVVPGSEPPGQAASSGGQGPPQNIIFSSAAWQQNSGAGTPTAPVMAAEETAAAANNPETVTPLLGNETAPAEAGGPQAVATAGTAAGTGQSASEILGNASAPGIGAQPRDRLQDTAATPSAGADGTYARRAKDLSPAAESQGRPKGQAGGGDAPIVKHQYQNQATAQGNTYLQFDTSDPSVEEIYIEQQTGLADDLGLRQKSRPAQSQALTAAGNSDPPEETTSTADPGEEVAERPAQQNAVADNNKNTANAATDANRQDTTDGPDGVQRTEGQGLENRQAQAADASQNRPEARSSVEQTRTVQQLSDTILSSVTLKKGRAVIQLHPPELGRVRIHLTLTHGNELRAVFVTETREARLMIESHIEALRAHLDQRGLTMTDCSVDMNNNQGFSLRQHSGNGQAGLWWGRGNRPFAPDGQDVPEAVGAETVLARPANGRVDLVI